MVEQPMRFARFARFADPIYDLRFTTEMEPIRHPGHLTGGYYNYNGTYPLDLHSFQPGRHRKLAK